ncbi:BA75_00540T0 [Komagataella pastoris]|uniref:BA75_00540T0 n=1 Tax=Komagataella pastoris TaxID=4922 RepID=A0A1B2J8L6_PICPA|nr:BA75_00540T0 [Komagataella pastoris]
MEKSGKMMPISEMNIRKDNYSQLYSLVDVLLAKLDTNRQLKRSLFRRMEALSKLQKVAAQRVDSSELGTDLKEIKRQLETIPHDLGTSLNSLRIDEKPKIKPADEESELAALRQENLRLREKIAQTQIHNARMVQLLGDYENNIMIIVDRLRDYIIQSRQSSVDKLREQNEKLHEKTQEVNRLIGELLSYQESVAEQLPPLLNPLKRASYSDSSESELRDSFEAFYLDKYAREALAALYSDK